MSFPFQTSYPLNMPIGVPGRIADNCFKNTLNPTAGEDILPALGVFKAVGQDYVVVYPNQNLSTNVFSADLVTGNTINGTVNGVALTPIVFATSHLATMNAIAAAIAAQPNIQSAVVGGASDRTITVTADPGFAAVLSGFVVTGGASQATVTTTTASSGQFFGVSQHVYNIPNNWPIAGNEVGQLPFLAGNPVPVLTMGRIYVPAEDVVTAESPVYVRFAANGLNTILGSFRGTDDSGTAVLIPDTQAKWREGNGVAGGIAVLELTLS